MKKISGIGEICDIKDAISARLLEICIQRYDDDKLKMSKELNISTTSLYETLNGKHIPTRETIVKITDKHKDISATWIFFGVGNVNSVENDKIALFDPNIYSIRREKFKHIVSLTGNGEQTLAAKRIGKSKGYVSQLCTSRDISDQVWVSIIDAYPEVKKEWFLGLSDTFFEEGCDHIICNDEKPISRGDKDACKRMALVRESVAGGDNTSFSFTLKCNYQHCAEVCNGTRPLTRKMAEKVSSSYGINIDWLLFGTGPMKKNGVDISKTDLRTIRTDKLSQILEKVFNSNADLMAHRLGYKNGKYLNLVINGSESMTDSMWKKVMKNIHEAPVGWMQQLETSSLDNYVTAGELSVNHGGRNQSFCKEPISAFVNTSNIDRYMAMEGNAMSPRIEGGDILACSDVFKESFILSGKIYRLETSAGIIVGRAYPQDDHIVLRFDNASYHEVSIPLGEIQRIALVRFHVSQD